MPTPTVRRVAPHEVRSVARMIARAFADDPIERWSLAGDDVTGLIEVEASEAARQLTAEGWLWAVDDLSGVAAWLPPGGAYDEAIDAAVAQALAASGGDPKRYTECWTWIESHRPVVPHWYLDLLAVDPGRQQLGTGSHLLADGLARADGAGGATFLVTGNLAIVPWYQRHGFAVGAEGRAPGGGPVVCFLERTARTGSER